MNFIDSHTTTVRMLPVCECGQIIDNLQAEIYVMPTKNTNVQASMHLFSPSCCPNCGKYIENIEIQNKYLTMFHKKT